MHTSFIQLRHMRFALIICLFSMIGFLHISPAKAAPTNPSSLNGAKIAFGGQERGKGQQGNVHRNSPNKVNGGNNAKNFNKNNMNNLNKNNANNFNKNNANNLKNNNLNNLNKNNVNNLNKNNVNNLKNNNVNNLNKNDVNNLDKNNVNNLHNNNINDVNGNNVNVYHGTNVNGSGVYYYQGVNYPNLQSYCKAACVVLSNGQTSCPNVCH